MIYDQILKQHQDNVVHFTEDFVQGSEIEAKESVVKVEVIDHNLQPSCSKVYFLDVL